MKLSQELKDYISEQNRRRAQPYRRFMVLAWQSYYPGGGITGDLEGSFDNLDEARAFAKSESCDGYEIFDRVDGVIVETD
jgi:hypothetical protein